MTEPVLGSSLLQARDSSEQPHIRHYSHHARSHQRLHNRQNQASGSDTSVVSIIRTISVVEFIDSTGGVVELETQLPNPTATSFHAETTDLNVPGVAAGSGDDATDAPTTSSSLDPTPAASLDSSVLSMSTSFPTVESFSPVTSAHLSGSSSFPSFSGVSNSTRATASSSSLLNNATSTSKPFVAFNLTTSYLPNSSGTVLYNSSFTTTLGQSSSTSVLATSSGRATSTGSRDGGFGSAGGGVGGGATGGSPSSSTSTSDSGSGTSSSNSPSAGTVAGGVLGAVAGVAMILIVALMLLRWKKRQNALNIKGDTRDSGGLLIAGRASGGGGGGGGVGVVGGSEGGGGSTRGMSEISGPRSIPFFVPAALASLTGTNRFSHRTATSSESGEKGFQKVSGRKLPSVLQHGGDGFSEPSDAHNSVLSDQSFYRDSQGFYGGPDIPRVAVGSPMRPDSGIPIFHPGPARTPVTEQGHFNPGLEPPRRDPLGRSHPSMDGSGSNRSRFTEEI